jgi:hypothetical protein
MSGPSSIIGVNAVRIARLTSTGAPDFNNALGAFVMCGGTSSFEHDFQTESGVDLFERDAAGNPCVIRRKPDSVKYATFTLTMCRSDYRMNEIMGISNNVTLGQTVVGHAVKVTQGCTTPSTFYGVSLELWSEQWDCASAMTNMPYMRAILPRCYLTPKGFKRENGVSMPVFQGFSVANDLWGDGPFGDADVMASQTGWCYAEIDDPALPQCPSPVGYVNIPPTGS